MQREMQKTFRHENAYVFDSVPAGCLKSSEAAQDGEPGFRASVARRAQRMSYSWKMDSRYSKKFRYRYRYGCRHRYRLGAYSLECGCRVIYGGFFSFFGFGGFWPLP